MKLTSVLLAFSSLLSFSPRSKTHRDGIPYATAEEVRALPADALYPAPQGGKWGYINARREWVIAPTYDEVTEFVGDRAAVAIRPSSAVDGHYLPQWGLIDRTGRRVVPCQYQNLECGSEGLARARLNDRWGFIDGQGRVVVPCQYEDVGAFSEGLACVSVDERNGFIDRQGRMVIVPRFTRLAFHCQFLDGYARVYSPEANREELGGYIDKTGQYVIRPQFEFVDPFLEGLAVVRPLHSPFYGLLDKRGKWVIPPDRYENALGFSEGLCSVARQTPDKKTWRWSVVDPRGQVVLAELPYRMVGAFVGGCAPVQRESSRGWGFIDRQGHEVIPAIYAGFNHFHNGLARMETSHSGESIVYLTPAGHRFWPRA